MRTIIIGLVLIITPLLASTFTGKAEINGIWYNINTKGNVAEVIKPDNGKYLGDVVIQPLDGQLPDGLYIVNGKKVILK